MKQEPEIHSEYNDYRETKSGPSGVDRQTKTRDLTFHLAIVDDSTHINRLRFCRIRFCVCSGLPGILMNKGAKPTFVHR
jgi:hypothetical protein